MTHCQICGEAALHPLWVDGSGVPWHRCVVCGSDSAERRWDDVRSQYGDRYPWTENVQLDVGVPLDQATLEQIRAAKIAGSQFNYDFFKVHQNRKDIAPSRDFLDIGCMEGAGLIAMAERGWKVVGFDVNPFAKVWSPGIPVTVADQFRANLFPQRFGAVMAREVIEHAPGWRSLLEEIHAVCLPGALVQIQTPRPTAAIDPQIYHHGHLYLFAPYTLRYWFGVLGFDVLDYRLYDPGQVWMLRRNGRPLPVQSRRARS